MFENLKKTKKKQDSYIMKENWWHKNLKKLKKIKKNKKKN